MTRNNNRYTDDQILEAMRTCRTIYQLIDTLGGKRSTGLHYHLSSRIKKAGWDWPIFLGSRSSKGKTFPNKRKPANEIFDMNHARTRLLRRALFDIGRKYLCEKCGTGGEWCGQELVLEIHHKDRDRKNNKPDNLIFLCPNCHSQTHGK